jgi:hypothetical protein
LGAVKQNVLLFEFVAPHLGLADCHLVRRLQHYLVIVEKGAESNLRIVLRVLLDFINLLWVFFAFAEATNKRLWNVLHYLPEFRIGSFQLLPHQLCVELVPVDRRNLYHLAVIAHLLNYLFVLFYHEADLLLRLQVSRLNGSIALVASYLLTQKRRLRFFSVLNDAVLINKNYVSELIVVDMSLVFWGQGDLAAINELEPVLEAFR